MNRIIFTGGQVFDGTGSPPVPADVIVRDERVERWRRRWARSRQAGVFRKLELAGRAGA